MTLRVSRDDETVTIHGNTNLGVKIQDSRVAEFTVAEHWQHLRHFHGELGRQLEAAEQAAVVRAQAAQEAKV
jgi:hypothetical protein